MNIKTYALIFLISTKGFSQFRTIKGKLINTINDSVNYFQIGLFSKDSLIIKGALSDSVGNFQFDRLAIGSYLIGTSLNKKIFYRKIVIDQKDTTVTMSPIILDNKVVQLNELKVFGRKKIIERDFEKLIVNIENMMFAKSRGILELLPQLPGLKIDPFGGIILNGKGGVTFLIDGKSIGANSGQATSVLNSMSAESVEKVEIISNPSSKYDSQGSGGIINIVTKKQKASSEIRIGLGAQLFPKGLSHMAGLNYNNENIGGTLNYLFNKVKTFANFDISRRKDYQESKSNRTVFSDDLLLDKSVVLKSLGKSVFARLGASYEISKSTSLDFSLTSTAAIPYRAVNYERNNISYNDIRKDSVIDFQNSQKTNFSYHTISFGVLKNFENKISKSISVGIDFSAFKTNEVSFFRLFSGEDRLNQTEAFETESTIRKIIVFSKIIKLDYSFEISKVMIDVGVKATINKDNDDYAQSGLFSEKTKEATTNSFHFEEIISAGYFNVKKTFDKSKLQIGLRNENTNIIAQSVLSSKIKNSFINFFPNFNYQYNFSKEHQIQISYSRRIRRPNFEEYNNFIYAKSPLSFKKGNTGLSPQYNNVAEITYNTSKISYLFSYSLSKKVRDIYSSSIDIEQINEIVNISKIENIYFLFSAPINFSKVWTTNNSLDIYYQNSTLPQLNKRGALGYDFSTNQNIKLKNSRLESRFSFASSYKTGYLTIKNIASLSFGWNKDLSQKVILNVSLNDILGTSKLSSISDYSNQVINSKSINNSRNFKISLRYKFKTGNGFQIKSRPNAQNGEIRNR